MQEHHLLIGGGAQAFKTVAIDDRGMPTKPSGTPTYALLDLRKADTDSGREIVAAGTSATVENYAQTTTAAAGYGTDDATEITVTDVDDPAAPTKGDRYLIEDPYGRREVFVVDRVDTANQKIWAEQPIQGEFASGSTVKSCELGGTFPEATAALEENEAERIPYAVDWSVSGVHGVTTWREFIWLERKVQPIRCTPLDVLLIDQDFANLLRGRGLSIPRYCQRAHAEFQAILDAKNIPADAIYLGRHGAIIESYLAATFLYRALQRPEDAEWAFERYRFFERNALQGTAPHGVHQVDRQTDTASTDPAPTRRSKFREA